MFDELDELILVQLKSISRNVGAFVTGVLTDELTREDQLGFAHRLVDLAELIRQRVEQSVIIIEGDVVDGRAIGSGQPGTPRDD